jgi:undecaprenyl-diphosphatase
MSDTTIVAGLLGVLEGLTEFIPVSSTGHLLLAGHFIGFESAGKTFEVVIQLGAILALLWVYFGKISSTVAGLGHDPAARRFAAGILIAFLPAAIAGVLLHGFIKTVLFETPWLIAVMLVVGGVVLLVVDRVVFGQVHDRADAFPLHMAFGIGLFQCLALVPGVSRSGATIVGALFLGASKRAAAEFSFFLSIPTMAGAFTYDLWKNRDILDFSAVTDIAVGFLAAFLAALAVVRWLLGYVSRRGYALFAWWRIVVGGAALIALAAGV